MAEAMVRNKDYSHARQELQRSLGRSEKLGLRLETARIHYLMGACLRLSGSATEAAGQYGEALRLLDEMRNESGADQLMNRPDLKAIYDDATRWTTAKS